MAPELQLTTVRGCDLTPGQRTAIVDLVVRAYEEDLASLFESFSDATHVLGTLHTAPDGAGVLASHALWVTRWLQIGSGPLLRTAYVELVATDAAWRGRGYASTLMQRLAEEIRDFDIAALSPFSVTYYARLGWERWLGPLLIRKEGELLPTPEDEEVMILRLPNTPPLDVRSELSVEWREGEVW